MYWTEQQDRKIVELQERGLSCREIAEKLGVTRNAVIARSNRIRNVVFPSDRKRGHVSTKQARKNRQRRAKEREAQIAKARKMLSGAGAKRDDIIVQAARSGISKTAIAAAVGVRYARIWQIVAGV